MQVIDEAGIQRICRNIFALQQTLTNITMTREVALDHARHYFELFFLTPEVICLLIVSLKSDWFDNLTNFFTFKYLCTALLLEYQSCKLLLHLKLTLVSGNFKWNSGERPTVLRTGIYERFSIASSQSEKN